jgi:sucrose-6-phosphate hydrolase SacC (GH32 family)
MRNSTPYTEAYRPQFHFTAQRGWLNDPNGLVFYRNEYHLFFQHNPTDVNWGNMTWGHAISHDLVHWQQKPDAIEPDSLGTIFSGSAVVDWDNTTGFQHGRHKPLVAIYTAAGGTSPESQGKPFTQCIAYSTDRGRTWTKYDHNPVLPHLIASNRDPKVVWYAPTRRWIMALYLDGEEFGLFTSPDLKTWTHLHNLTLPGCGECPDFFEIPLEGHEDESRWVFTAANGHYLVGTFDGEHFTPETEPLQVDYGANFYAVQTYSDIPASDPRRIQIAWMSGGNYPRMPFNQQMSFPCELTLRATPEGPRLYRWPVREIKSLYTATRRQRNMRLQAGNYPIPDLTDTLWDIEAEFELQDAASFGFKIRGEEVRYNVRAGTLTCLGRTAPLTPQDNRITLRVLVDSTSLEVFGNGGQVSLTSCFLPSNRAKELSLQATGGAVRLDALRVHSLRSAWLT